MDPNETLHMIRTATRLMATPGMDHDEWSTLAANLANDFVALDEWLSKGEYFPEAWGERQINLPYPVD